MIKTTRGKICSVVILLLFILNIYPVTSISINDNSVSSIDLVENKGKENDLDQIKDIDQSSEELIIDTTDTNDNSQIKLDSTPISSIIHPLGFSEFDDINNYLEVIGGYIGGQNISLESLKTNPSRFIEGTSMIGWGILRGMEVLSYRQENITNSLAMVEDALTEINKFRMPSGIYSLNTSNLPENHKYHTTGVGANLSIAYQNAFAILLLMELVQVYYGYPLGSAEISYSNSSFFDLDRANELVILANQTYFAMEQVFRIDSIEQTYAELAFAEEAFVNSTGFVESNNRTDVVYAKTNGIMYQVLVDLVNLGYVHATQIYTISLPSLPDYIVYLRDRRFKTQHFTNNWLSIDTVPYDTIRSEPHLITNTTIFGRPSWYDNPFTGIVAEYVNITNSEKSNTSSLLDQLFRIENFLFGGLSSYFFPSEVGASVMNDASDLMYNVFKLFVNEKGLPVSWIYNNESKQSEKSITYEIYFLLGTLRRLSSTWDEIAKLFPDDLFNEKSRTWLNIAIQLKNTLKTYLLDDQTNSFFPLYDNDINGIIRDDSIFESNSFVANALMQETVSTSFPFEVSITTQNGAPINTQINLSYELNNITFGGSATFFTHFISGEVKVKIEILKNGVTIKSFNDLVDITGGVSGSFSYKLLEKGFYDVVVELSKEGEITLSQTFSLQSLGFIRTHGEDSFVKYTDTPSFITDMEITDENNIALEGLELTYLIKTENDTILNQQNLTTDKDGSISLDVNINNLNILYDSELKDPDDFVHIKLVLNSSNAMVFSLSDFEAIYNLTLYQSSLNVLINPSILEVTQGLDRDYQFQITVLNQNDDPVNLAQVKVIGNNINPNNVEIRTNANGIALIEINRQEISSLVPNEYTVLDISVSHNDYPLESSKTNMYVEGNNIRIFSTPAQKEIREKTLLETTSDQVFFKIDTEDSYGNQLSSQLRFDWVNKDGVEITNPDYPDLPGDSSIAPLSFSINPSSLNAGIYGIRVTASKTGFIDSNFQIDIKVRQATLTEASLIIVGLVIFTVALWVLAWGKEIFLKSIGRLKECPHCKENTKGNALVCRNCGRDTLFQIVSKKDGSKDDISDGDIPDIKDDYSDEDMPEIKDDFSDEDIPDIKGDH